MNAPRRMFPRAAGPIGPAPRVRRRARPAFSLVDVVMGIIVASVVAAAIGGVLVLLSKAVPQSASATTPTLVPRARLADDIATELRYATGFSVMEARAVSFTVPDRDADGKDELIRYQWGGNTGDPVTRQYNGSAPVTIAQDIKDLSFTYAKRKVTTTQNVAVPSTSAETLLASFSGWNGITASQSGLTVGTAAWNSQAFRIDPAMLPPGAKNLTITRVRLKMKKPLLGGADAIVSIHRRQSVGSNLPATSGGQVGSTASINFALLTLSFAWVTATYSDVVFATPETDLCIVIKGPTATSAQVQYLNAAGAPVDTNYYRWTTDGGATWLPNSGHDANDAYYEVWGTWEATQTSTQQTDAWFLRAIDVSLDGGGPGSAIRATARVLNEPEVVGP